jgi:hypothetical protein
MYNSTQIKDDYYMDKNLNNYNKQIKEVKESGGVQSRKVDLSHSNDDPLVKSYKNVAELLKKI